MSSSRYNILAGKSYDLRQATSLQGLAMTALVIPIKADPGVVFEVIPYP
jgi:hypothetical protein